MKETIEDIILGEETILIMSKILYRKECQLDTS